MSTHDHGQSGDRAFTQRECPKCGAVELPGLPDDCYEHPDVTFVERRYVALDAVLALAIRVAERHERTAGITRESMAARDMAAIIEREFSAMHRGMRAIR